MIKLQKRNKTQDSKDKQRGITLLLSVLIMSGLLIITITVAALGLSEMRQSRAFIYTEPAIGAAQSGAENAIWNLKRSGTLTDCPNNTSTGLTGTVGKGTYCKDTTSPVSFLIRANKDFTFYLFDQSNINGNRNLCGSGNNDPFYTELSFDYLDTASLDSSTPDVSVSITRLDNSPVDSGILSFSSGTQPLTLDNTVGLVSCPTPNDDNRMIVTLSTPQDVWVQVSTTNTHGIPSFPTLKAVGCSGLRISSPSINCDSTNSDIYSRSLEVTVPQ